LTSPLLEVRNLRVSYPSRTGATVAVRNVSFQVLRGETFALVGETGSGKSTTALALLGLLDAQGAVQSGAILVDGRNLMMLSQPEWRRIRGGRIGMLFQDSRAALNPVLTAGAHLVEAIRTHQHLSGAQARALALELLAAAGVPDPGFHMRRFPFQLSTGLCQRIGLALAICNRPELLIADEPTSALDPTIQRQVIELLRNMKDRHRLTLLVISHDLPLVAGLADRIGVMYHGRILECGNADEILRHAAHPYTQALLDCRPGFRHHHDTRRIHAIAGSPPTAETEIPGCPFTPRCGAAQPECAQLFPPDVRISQTHQAACFRVAGGEP